MRIINPDKGLLYEILLLAVDIDLKRYAEYISQYSEYIGLFGYFDDKLKGFIHAEPPHPLTPDVGFISMASGSLPKEIGITLLTEAEDWLLSQGASIWRMTTKRNPVLWRRRWGLECMGEVDGEFVLQKCMKK